MAINKIQESIIKGQLSRVSKVGQNPKGSAAASGAAENFDHALQNAEIQFSKHAEKRLASRQIEFSPMDRAELNQAFRSLEAKGARDSLVLMGDLALIVNVPSKTVVTALRKEQMKEQVFTNIDSTILVTRSERDA